MVVLCSSLFWYALLYVLSSFAIVLTGTKKLVALLLLSFGCLVTVNVLWLLLTVPWVGQQFVIVVFPYHTHLRSEPKGCFQLFLLLLWCFLLPLKVCRSLSKVIKMCIKSDFEEIILKLATYGQR